MTDEPDWADKWAADLCRYLPGADVTALAGVIREAEQRGRERGLRQAAKHISAAGDHKGLARGIRALAAKEPHQR